MKTQEFITLFSLDPDTTALAACLTESDKQVLHLTGLRGSADVLIAGAVYEKTKHVQFFILETKEEALYFADDLQQLHPEREVLFFPSSYKKPYQFEEVENANVLQRAEVLNRLHIQDALSCAIVTYPDALTEKVVSKKSLIKNTWAVKVGDSIDLQFLTELLHSYDFEHSDFVYEAGQFSIRGGIIDIYSFSNELPYRIELSGNEVESIRTFDPNTQLSVESKKAISIIPNVHHTVVMATTESIFDFLPSNSQIWVENATSLWETLEAYYTLAVQTYSDKIQKQVPENLLEKPESRFEQVEHIRRKMQAFQIIEYKAKPYFEAKTVFSYIQKAQPPFKKDIHLVAKDLASWQERGFTACIVTESYSQFQKLQTIFEEIDPFIKIQHVHLSLHEGFVDERLKLVCYTDHQIFERFHRYKTKEKHSKSRAITLKELKALHPGDYVTHSDYGIAKFVGLEKVEINGVQQEAIRLLFKDNDLMKVSILALHKISKYAGKEGEVPTMSKLGSPEWENKKKAVKKKVKEIAIDLIGLYAKRKAAPGFAFSPDNYLQAELETSFIYEDTPDQAKATDDVKADMCKPHPMDRLVCGDVGFGKTEVAVRAAFKAACDGKQVAVLVPTTILAMQHYKTFKDRLEKFPIRVEYISRFRSAGEIRQTLKNVQEGKTEILIGTHRILSKDVKFKDLGLLIIDEEQKFGVSAKEKLRELRVNVDTLTLTATPIPRTLHFSLMGARDLSIIATPPPNRQPVTTEAHTFSETLIRDAIAAELQRDGQAFVVHNRISDLYSLADLIKRLVPEARVAVAHGQMDGEELENVMVKFIDHEYDVLVSTNIIESGLDIPNANTIIINQAHHFGLSDLHQMRGRVGRSNRKAYCYLLTPPASALSADGRKKIMALEEFSDLGDGFKVAMRDLDIRGAGNLLGAEQTGFITDLGFEVYHQLLDEAIRELKETEFKSLFAEEVAITKNLLPECSIETDLSLLIPDSYVSNISERLSLYNELDNVKNEAELTEFMRKLKDRFGNPTQEVLDLAETVRIRWMAEQIGFDKISIKSGVLRAQFAYSSSAEYFNGDKFGKILQYVQKNPKTCSLKETKDKLILIVQHIPDLQHAKALFESIL